MRHCIFLKSYFSKISKRTVNYCIPKSSYVNLARCEECGDYDPKEEVEIEPPQNEYIEHGKVIKTLASEKKETKVLTKTDLDRQLERFRSPIKKGGGKHGKQKKQRGKSNIYQ